MGDVWAMNGAALINVARNFLSRVGRFGSGSDGISSAAREEETETRIFS
jgi:hypothetical protein